MWDYIGKISAALILGRLLWSSCKGLHSLLFATMLRLNMDLSKTGSWAVVTGATDGIGKAYAFELAKRGLNIVLISRTPAKLEAVAEEIKKKYPVTIKTIAADFTKLDIYDGISKQLADLDIGVLVNNVGMSYEYPEYVTKYPNLEEFASTLLNMNIHSVNRMTFIVLPGMEARKRGVIINISSLSAVIPTPFLSLYAATKSYVESFSRNLDLELTGKGITIQCVIPGFVVSNLSGMKRSSLMVPTPASFVKQAISTVGVEKRTAGYAPHKLMIYVLELLDLLMPACLWKPKIYNDMLTLKIKSQKKREREAKSN